MTDSSPGGRAVPEEPDRFDPNKTLILTDEQHQQLLELATVAFSEIEALCRPVHIDGFFHAIDPPSDPLASPMSDLYRGLERQREVKPRALEELGYVCRAHRIGAIFQRLLPLCQAYTVRPVETIGLLDSIDGTPTRWGTFAVTASSIFNVGLPEKREVVTVLQAVTDQALSRQCRHD